MLNSDDFHQSHGYPKLALPVKPAMELLAPAGDIEALRAALSAGADAVYLGGKLFNARRSAANFDLEQLQEASDLLHMHNKRIYVTVNTLIHDTELTSALDYLAQLYNIGVDAVIIQDWGLIRLARKYLPELALHASTQMTVHNSEGACFLKKRGIARVVLAREMTEMEVAQVTRSAEVETEVFVHGALCLSYSGQCLMSSMIGGRSGNRGRCAQPCRMEYELIRNGAVLPTPGSYLLSSKDLALATLIPQLHKAGVTSLKIEGRMKRPEYVYAIVRSYRRFLDRYFADPDRFRVAPEELREMEESFNRGFTTGYFGNNRNAELMSFTRPNNRGIFLGRVISTAERTGHIRLKLGAPLENGDGIEVWVSKGGRGVATIGELFAGKQKVAIAQTGTIVEFPFPQQVFPGDRVFKVSSIRLQKQTQAAIDPDNPALQSACDIEVSGEAGRPLLVIYRDHVGNEGKARTGSLLEVAKKRPLSEEILREHLGRLGNSGFYLDRLTVRLPEGLMMPFSELNQVRREAVDRLRQVKLSRYHRIPVQLHPLESDLPSREKRMERERRSLSLSVWVADLESVQAASRAGADLIYAGGDELTGFDWTEERLQEALAIAHTYGSKLVMGMPRINAEKSRELWTRGFERLTEIAEDGIILSDISFFRMALQSLRPLFLNYTLNLFNSSALRFFADPQVKQVAISPELTLQQIAALNRVTPDMRIEALAHGPLELMLSEYCPIASLQKSTGGCQGRCKTDRFWLRDRLHLDFPVYTDQFCRMHLLNSKDHCLYSDLDKLAQSGLSVIRLELKTCSSPQVEFITRAYRDALDKLPVPPEDEAGERVIAKWKQMTGRGITKGHFFRGVE